MPAGDMSWTLGPNSKANSILKLGHIIYLVAGYILSHWQLEITNNGFYTYVPSSRKIQVILSVCSSHLTVWLLSPQNLSCGVIGREISFFSREGLLYTAPLCVLMETAEYIHLKWRDKSWCFWLTLEPNKNGKLKI